MSLAALNHSGPVTPAQGPPVVRSSPGRLRIHLPDADGHSVARLRGLPGVRSAEASEWTGNILIRFDPRQTSEEVLLAELQPLAVSAPPSPPSAGGPASQADNGAGPDGGYVTGVRARVYKVVGWSSVGMAVVGAITPGIPTAPFVILAGYLFIRSSPSAHAWLRASPWFGPLLRDWEEQRGVRRSVKYTGAGLIGVGMAIVPLLGLPVVLTASILACQIVGLGIVLSLRVVEPAQALPAPVAV